MISNTNDYYASSSSGGQGSSQPILQEDVAGPSINLYQSSLHSASLAESHLPNIVAEALNPFKNGNTADKLSEFGCFSVTPSPATLFDSLDPLSGATISLARTIPVAKDSLLGAVGLGGSATLGIPPFLIGPYVSGGISVGINSDGDLILQVQGFVGLGVGIFFGAGPSVQGGYGERPSAGVSPEVGWQGEISAGAGPESLQLQVQGSENGAGFSTDLRKPPKAIAGFGLGLAASAGVGRTATLSFRTVERWNDLVSSWERTSLAVEARINSMKYSRPPF